MKITKEKCKLELPIDIELSTKCRKELGHQPKQCYDNALELLLRGLIDTYVIGWVLNDSLPIPIRHGFGLKDGKIVDSTLKLLKVEKYSYYTMLELNVGDVNKLYDEFESKSLEMYSCLQGYIGYGIENKIQYDILKDLQYTNR